MLKIQIGFFSVVMRILIRARDTIAALDTLTCIYVPGTLASAHFSVDIPLITE